MQKKSYALFIVLLFWAGVKAQVSQVEFGKNRVQYHEDFEEWSQYDSDNFITYWYGRARNVGQAAVQLAEYDFEEIQGLLEHRLNQKIQIIVYSDLTDLKQSNIGGEETFNNTGGQTKIVGNIVFVYYDGNFPDLRRQIREGVAEVYLNSMLFGANIQEVVQNAVMLNLPDWFKSGLVAYVGKVWDTGRDNQLRDYLLSSEYEGFGDLAEEYPELAGHALWYYISERYGSSTVSNLLYLTRINRSVESGFLYVMGSTYENLIRDWEDYFRQRYQAESQNRNTPLANRIEFKNRKELPLTTIKISPDGTKLVYVLNDIGKYKVFLYDLARNEQKRIFKKGFRNTFQATDLNYPLLAWNPNGQQLAIMYEFRDQVNFLTYDIFTGKEEEIPMAEQYTRVFSIDYIDPFTMVLSASVSSQTDIYLFYPRTRQSQRITSDFFDDRDAVFTEVFGQRGILFASNRKDTLMEALRLDTVMPVDPFDIFYYNLDSEYRELVRVTATPFDSERYPQAFDSTYFVYLSDRSGIVNREAGRLESFVHHYDQRISLIDGAEIVMHADSSLEKLDTALIDTIVIEPVIRQRAITHNLTNYRDNILLHDVARRSKKAVEVFSLTDEGYVLRTTGIDPDQRVRAPRTFFQRNTLRLANWLGGSADTLAAILEKDDNYAELAELPVADSLAERALDNFFQSEFSNPDTKAADSVRTVARTNEASPELLPALPEVALPGRLSTQKDVYRFRPGRITPYRLQFRTDYVTSQMDNSLLFEGLNNFAANPDGIGFPPPGILLKANVKDIFEDYEFEGGIRIPTNFNGAEYFIVFNDKKKRLDKRYAVYMRRLRQNEESVTQAPNRRESVILLGQYGLRYPLDVFRSLRATATIRQDRLIQLATERNSLNTATLNAQRVGMRLEYVFDNTMDISMNIKNGTRYKVFGEIMKKFSLNADQGVNLEFSDGYLGLLGVDARHYQPLLKHSVFAARLAAATSFGSEKILYFLGGTDNWVFPSRNTDIPPPAGNFAFQTLATNLRGFRTGIRNGNSYALLNTELRIPLFKYLSRNVTSPFLKNFQVVGFFDVGTAWEGFSPYRDDNPLNTSVFEDSDIISVTVNYFRDPIVAGYGLGARTVLFGYFIRVDYAWGIETQVVQDPRLFISLGMDF